MAQTMIFHICRREDWEKAATEGVYRASSLETEGFIHCSTPKQLVSTANLLFRGEEGLVLLHIESQKVEAEIEYENTTGGEDLFPHIYGSLNLDAVQKVVDFQPGLDGRFEISLEG